MVSYHIGSGILACNYLAKQFFHQIAISIMIRIYKGFKINEYKCAGLSCKYPKNVLQLVHISSNFKIPTIGCLHVIPTNQCRFSLVQYIRCLLIYLRINPFHTSTIDLQMNVVQKRISTIIGQNTISGVFYNPNIRFIALFI